MKKFLLNPLCASIITLIAIVVFKGLDRWFYPAGSLDFYAANQALEKITYGLYGIVGIVAVVYRGDFVTPKKKKTFWALMFLWLAALLREMGVQHWLTQHDTTAIKLRFFTNPNNPLHEKILAGLLVILVVGVVLALLGTYFKRIIRGILRLNPLYWTIATFGGVLIISQFCDRFPSKYFKATGVRLNEDILAVLKLIEEGGEACLPILFALGLIQHHLTVRDTNASS